MKVLLANLPDAIENTLLNIKLGLYNANTLGTLSIDPESTVEFDIEVVTADTFNTIDRTSTTTPAADEVTTDVTDAYNETTVRTPATVTTNVADSYSETTTRSPATTQTDDSTTGGGDASDTMTTWTEFTT